MSSRKRPSSSTPPSGGSSPLSAGSSGAGGSGASGPGGCRLEVSLTSREWKKAYFGDRPPRLLIKLLNPPPDCPPLTLCAFTSFIGDVPVITTKKKTIVSDRKSQELVVKQMQNQATKCMKFWTHCGYIRGLEALSGETGETFFRCDTAKHLEEWVEAIRNNENHEGSVFLKPDDVKVHMVLRNGVLSVRESPSTSGTSA
jgi:hypothetical protein